MQPYRAVHGGDEGHLDVQNVHQDFSAFAIDLVVSHRAEKVEALGTDRLHECLAGARQNHDAITGIGAYSVKQVYELLVSVSVEDERASVGVEGYFQHTSFGAGEAGVWEAVSVGSELRHDRSSCSG